MRGRCSGFQLVMLQKSVMHKVSRKVMNRAQNTRILAPPPDGKRPSRVSPCQKSVIRCPTPKVAGKEEGSESGDESGPLPVPKSAPMVSGRPHHRFSHTDRSFDVSRWKVGKVDPGAIRYEKPCSTTILPECASDVPQVGGGACAPSGRKRRNRRRHCRVPKSCFAPGNLASPWFTASCCREMGPSPSFSRSGSRKLLWFHQCLREWRQLTLARSQH